MRHPTLVRIQAAKSPAISKGINNQVKQTGSLNRIVIALSENLSYATGNAW